MTQIITFYEKPGCAGNAKQKKMLMEAGITLVVKDMLSEPWSETTLLSFFKDAPVSEWFNPFAPKVKSGEVDPESLTKEEALARMIAEPILIKRPLMRYKETTFLGFDPQELAAFFPALDGDKENPGTCSSSDPCHT